MRSLLLAVALVTGVPAVARAEVPKIDILVLIDDSGSTVENTDLFIAELPAFMDALGPADLHLGVISQDMGIPPYSAPGCDGDGDGGRLQHSAHGTCTPPAGAFISDGPGGKNYDGTLEDTFRCIARLGTAGCGMEQSWKAVMRALDGSNPENAGFLREDAWLAVVVLSDEDDCSASDEAVFDASLDSLGPFGSFRCTEYGVTCDGMDLARTDATYDTCSARTDSYMLDPEELGRLLAGLKPDGTRRMYGAAIAAPPEPFAVAVNPASGEPYLRESCSSSRGVAYPGVRHRDFVGEFPHHALVSTCERDLGMPAIGAALHDLLSGQAAPDAGLPDAGSSGGGGGCRAGGRGGAGFFSCLLLIGLGRRRGGSLALAALLVCGCSGRARPADAGVESPAPSPQVIGDLAAGTRELERSIDPARGLLLVRYIEDPPTEPGDPGYVPPAREYALVCPGQPSPARGKVLDVLRDMASPSAGVECNPQAGSRVTCASAGQEYVPTRTVVSERDPARGHLLVEVTEISRINLTTAWQKQADAFLEQARAASRGGCH